MLGVREVIDARKEEVGYMQKRGIWELRSRRECREKTGRDPVSVGWVDTRKAEGIARSRLVARDFKCKFKEDREDLFAATPPLEGQRLLFSRAVTQRQKPKRKGVRKIMFIDAKKEHLNS